MFVSLFFVLTSEISRSSVEELFAFGAVLLSDNSLLTLVTVAALSVLCTYISVMSYVQKNFVEKTPENFEYDAEVPGTSRKKVEIPRGSARPKHIGILAADMYFPSTYVSQEDLECANGVAPGKYTKGLGQEGMSFVGDREDANSIALTVVHALLEKYRIVPDSIGRIEVGTESLVDKSKSTKTVLMDLFSQHGNMDIEGVTTINACYGGTAALLNSIAWIESSQWDGRYALVVAADIAVYDEGPARPTGGCGAVAILIGPNAPIVLEPGIRATYACNVWDFYKPDPLSEYPTVDGAQSQECYLRALDNCYRLFCQKNEEKGISKNGRYFDVASNDFAVFHSPYNKLVQKSFARLIFYDFQRHPNCPEFSTLLKWKDVPVEKTYSDRELDMALRRVAADMYIRMVQPSCVVSQQVGNCYTASVFCNILSLISGKSTELAGKRAMVFSYGSGSMATMYALSFRQTGSRFSIECMSDVMDLTQRLASREKCSPAEFIRHLNHRQSMHGLKEYSPVEPVCRLFPGTYFLVSINDKFQRVYRRNELGSKRIIGASSTPRAHAAKKVQRVERVHVVVTGVAAGLRNSDGCFGTDVAPLLTGENCILPIPSMDRKSMVGKNIVQIIRRPEGNERIRVLSEEDGIKLAGLLPSFDLATEYGIPQSLVQCMDMSSRVAIAAGLDAMKDAGLVKGDIQNGWGNWRLPDGLCDRTGVIFATSLPALDGAVNELDRFYKSATTRQISAFAKTMLNQIEEYIPNEHKASLEKVANETGDYEFDRKFLFRVLVLANAQLAQITGARGPNVQLNAACAGTTQAIGVAQDWLSLGRCDRVVVISGDMASGSTLIPWIGSGFRALGAACLEADVTNAALPFDQRRSGLILGSGAVGIVLEAASNSALKGRPTKCRLVDTHYSNSAFHGAALDSTHILHEFNLFLEKLNNVHGISRSDIAAHGIYISHETSTHSSPTSSCAFSEIRALKSAFGSDFSKLLITNTKGFTGHAMGVSFEDATAVACLVNQVVPPVKNFELSDPALGNDLNLSSGGKVNKKYALRFAAGFGSQVALALYST